MKALVDSNVEVPLLEIMLINILNRMKDIDLVPDAAIFSILMRFTVLRAKHLNIDATNHLIALRDLFLTYLVSPFDEQKHLAHEVQIGATNYTYNMILKNFIKISPNHPEISNILKELELHPILYPDNYTSSNLVKSYFKTAEDCKTFNNSIEAVNKVSKFVSLQSEKGIILDPLTANTMIDGYLKISQYKCACDCFQMLETIGVTPLVESYRLMITAHIIAGNFADADTNLSAMLDIYGNYSFNMPLLCALVNSWNKSDNFHYSETVYSVLRSEASASFLFQNALTHLKPIEFNKNKKTDEFPIGEDDESDIEDVTTHSKPPQLLAPEHTKVKVSFNKLGYKDDVLKGLNFDNEFYSNLDSLLIRKTKLLISSNPGRPRDFELLEDGAVKFFNNLTDCLFSCGAGYEVVKKESISFMHYLPSTSIAAANLSQENLYLLSTLRPGSIASHPAKVQVNKLLNTIREPSSHKPVISNANFSNFRHQKIDSAARNNIVKVYPSLVAGGSFYKPNIVLCNTMMHAYMTRKLYKEALQIWRDILMCINRFPTPKIDSSSVKVYPLHSIIRKDDQFMPDVSTFTTAAAFAACVEDPILVILEILIVYFRTYSLTLHSKTFDLTPVMLLNYILQTSLTIKDSQISSWVLTLYSHDKFNYIKNFNREHSNELIQFLESCHCFYFSMSSSSRSKLLSSKSTPVNDLPFSHLFPSNYQTTSNKLLPTFANEYTFHSVLHMISKTGDLKRMNDLLNLIEVKIATESSDTIDKIRANKYTWALVMQCYINAKQIMPAVHVFSSLVGRISALGRPVDEYISSATINILIRGLIHVGWVHIAVILLKKFHAIQPLTANFNVNTTSDSLKATELISNLTTFPETLKPEKFTFDYFFNYCIQKKNYDFASTLVTSVLAELLIVEDNSKILSSLQGLNLDKILIVFAKNNYMKEIDICIQILSSAQIPINKNIMLEVLKVVYDNNKREECALIVSQLREVSGGITFSHNELENIGLVKKKPQHRRSTSTPILEKIFDKMLSNLPPELLAELDSFKNITDHNELRDLLNTYFSKINKLYPSDVPVIDDSKFLIAPKVKLDESLFVGLTPMQRIVKEHEMAVEEIEEDDAILEEGSTLDDMKMYGTEHGLDVPDAEDTEYDLNGLLNKDSVKPL